MSISRPTENEVKLRHYGLARIQAIKTVYEGGKREPEYRDVEVFITGSYHYVSPDEARAIGELLIKEAEKCAALKRERKEDG